MRRGRGDDRGGVRRDGLGGVAPNDGALGLRQRGAAGSAELGGAFRWCAASRTESRGDGRRGSEVNDPFGCEGLSRPGLMDGRWRLDGLREVDRRPSGPYHRRCRHRGSERFSARDAEAHGALVFHPAVDAGERVGRRVSLRREVHIGSGRSHRRGGARASQWGTRSGRRHRRSEGAHRRDGRRREGRRAHRRGGGRHAERRRRRGTCRTWPTWPWEPLPALLAEDKLARIVPATRGAGHAHRWDTSPGRQSTPTSRAPSERQSASCASTASSTPRNWAIPESCVDVLESTKERR